VMDAGFDHGTRAVGKLDPQTEPGARRGIY
jgi:hypothetical protein